MKHRSGNKRLKQPYIDTEIGKELTYMVTFPLALQVSARRRGKVCPSNVAETYDKLRIVKNSLDYLIIGNARRNTAQYQERLMHKVLCEKLILNIASGQRKEVKSNLEQILQSEGLTFKEDIHYKLPSEEKLLIRLDYNGSIPPPNEEELARLSQTYKDFTPLPKERRPYQPEDYTLSQMPIWLVCRQFSEFRKLQYKVCDAFSERNIKPESISEMPMSDFLYILRYYMKKHKIMYEGAKSKFIKSFAKNHETDFRAYMASHADIIIENLLNHNIISDASKFDFNKYVDHAVKDMKENGRVPPMFSVHHKIPVKDGKNVACLSDVNTSPNLCLVIDPYHTVLHLFDTKDNGEDIFDRKVKRAELSPNLIFIGGLTASSRIYHDYGKDTNKRLLTTINNLFKNKDLTL